MNTPIDPIQPTLQASAERQEFENPLGTCGCDCDDDCDCGPGCC